MLFYNGFGYFGRHFLALPDAGIHYKIKEKSHRRPISTRKIQCFLKIGLKNAFGRDIVRKCDLAKTVVKLQFCFKMVLPDASGGAPERFLTISGGSGTGKPTCTKPS